MKTHYDVLGVAFGADYDTIRTAYRRALKSHHPDLHKGDAEAEQHSKEIIDAYAVLKDEALRTVYDQYLLHRRQQQRRLFLIAGLLGAGLVCAGSLVYLHVSSDTPVLATSEPPLRVTSLPLADDDPRRSAGADSPAPMLTPESIARVEPAAASNAESANIQGSWATKEEPERVADADGQVPLSGTSEPVASMESSASSGRGAGAERI